MTADLPAKILQRLAKSIRMLGSDQDGDVLNAARAMSRTLASVGKSLHDLAAVVEAGGSLGPRSSTLSRRERDARTPTPDPPPFYRTKPKWDELRDFEKRDWLTVFLGKLQLSPTQKTLISEYRVKLNAEERMHWQPSKRQLHLVTELLGIAWKAGVRP